METIELVVFMVIALILGWLVIGFVMDWDYSKTGDMFKKMITNDDNPKFEEVDADGFVRHVINAWDDCGYGVLNSTHTIYVNDDLASIDKSTLFAKLKKLNICKSLQSVSNDCGTREDITMNTKSLPAIVVLACHANNSTMSIT